MSNQCKNCNSQMSLKQNPSYTLPGCYHSICNSCVMNLTPDKTSNEGLQSVFCPICKKQQDIDFKLFKIINDQTSQIFQEEFKQINQAFTLAKSGLISYCRLHPDEQIRFYCKKEKQFICSNCIKNHFEHIERVEDYGQQRIKDHCQLLLQNVTKLKDQVDKIFNQLKWIYQNTMATESEVVSQCFNDASSLLEKHVNMQEILSKTYNFGKSQKIIFDSYIIKDAEMQKKLDSIINLNKKNYNLIFRASRDSFCSQNFHKACDNQSNLLIILLSKEKQKVFGAFTTVPISKLLWGTLIKDGKGQSFLFSIRENRQITKLQCIDKEKEIIQTTDRLVVFGEGPDLAVTCCSNLNKSSFANIGNTYELPDGIEKNTEESRSYLAGSVSFSLEEIEVYSIE